MGSCPSCLSCKSPQGAAAAGGKRSSRAAGSDTSGSGRPRVGGSGPDPGFRLGDHSTDSRPSSPRSSSGSPQECSAEPFSGRRFSATPLRPGGEAPESSAALPPASAKRLAGAASPARLPVRSPSEGDPQAQSSAIAPDADGPESQRGRSRANPAALRALQRVTSWTVSTPPDDASLLVPPPVLPLGSRRRSLGPGSSCIIVPGGDADWSSGAAEAAVRCGFASVRTAQLPAAQLAAWAQAASPGDALLLVSPLGVVPEEVLRPGWVPPGVRLTALAAPSPDAYAALPHRWPAEGEPAEVPGGSHRRRGGELFLFFPPEGEDRPGTLAEAFIDAAASCRPGLSEPPPLAEVLRDLADRWRAARRRRRSSASSEAEKEGAPPPEPLCVAASAPFDAEAAPLSFLPSQEAVAAAERAELVRAGARLLCCAAAAAVSPYAALRAEETALIEAVELEAVPAGGRPSGQPPANPIDGVFPPKQGAGGSTGPYAAEAAVLTWGRNAEGQLGAGACFRQADSPLPLWWRSRGDPRVRLVACGSYHTLFACAEPVTNRPVVLACGDGSEGQLGVAEIPPAAPAATPTRVGALDGHRVVDLSCGEAHSLVLTTAGLYGFGRNSEGQLGVGDKAPRPLPERVPLVADPARLAGLSAGCHHSVLLYAGGVWCCGWNADGQCGVGHRSDLPDPVEVPFFRRAGGGAVSVAAGVRHTVVLCTEGLFAFGSNRCGALGAVCSEFSAWPVPVQLNPAAAAVRGISAWFHSVAWGDGGVFVWGEAAGGKLGGEDGGAAHAALPMQLQGWRGADVESCVAAADVTLLLLRSGGVAVCGSGPVTGPLGCAAPQARLLPLPVKVRALSCGVSHCAVIARDHGCREIHIGPQQGEQPRGGADSDRASAAGSTTEMGTRGASPRRTQSGSPHSPSTAARPREPRRPRLRHSGDEVVVTDPHGCVSRVELRQGALCYNLGGGEWEQCEETMHYDPASRRLIFDPEEGEDEGAWLALPRSRRLDGALRRLRQMALAAGVKTDIPAS